MSDYDTIKNDLHPAFVMQAAGHLPVKADTGKLVYRSPFRVDNHPSFDIYFHADKNVWRWGDYAEGSGGDVIDLVGRLWPNEDKIARCWQLIGQQQGSGWTGPDVPEPEPFDGGIYESAERITEEVLLEHYMLAAEGGGEDIRFPAWTHVDLKDWDVLQSGTTLVIPYFNTEGHLSTYKTRSLDGRKLNAKGGKLCLYGAWKLADDFRDVILCEGETDTWTASHVLPEYLALGVPGAGQRPETLGADALAGRRVVIAFDGDDAGAKGALTWVRFLVGIGCEVGMMHLPGNKDLSDLTAREIRSLSQHIQYPTPHPDNIMEYRDSYWTANKDGDPTKQLSSWALRVARVLRNDSGEVAFEGLLLPTRAEVVLPAVDLATSNRLVSWCTRHGVHWTGGASDHQKLSQLLSAESFGLPTGVMTPKVGYHDGDFVWPDGHEGVRDWKYVPPTAAVANLDQVFDMEMSRQPEDEVAELLNMYSSDVITPMLAWMAASFVRPLFEEFPVLYVSGVSGTGKTTLVETVLPTMTGSLIETNLTNTTPHALAAFFGSSTSFPIWFDEYRPGMRAETKQMFDQMIRDSYNGKRSSKGGQDSSNLSSVTAFDTAVPVIVSGEDSMVETSIIDRCVLLRLTKDRQGIEPRDPQPIGRNLVHHFVSNPPRIASKGRYITVVPEGPEHLPARQRYNLGVLRWGWQQLEAALGYPDWFPALDLSRVVASGADAGKTSPVLDLLLWALEQPQFGSWCWVEDGFVYFSADNLLKEAKRADIFTLPVSNTKGVIDFFKDQYGATNKVVRRDGSQLRVWTIPSSVVE